MWVNQQTTHNTNKRNERRATWHWFVAWTRKLCGQARLAAHWRHYRRWTAERAGLDCAPLGWGTVARLRRTQWSWRARACNRTRACRWRSLPPDPTCPSEKRAHKPRSRCQTARLCTLFVLVHARSKEWCAADAPSECASDAPVSENSDRRPTRPRTLARAPRAHARADTLIYIALSCTVVRCRWANRPKWTWQTASPNNSTGWEHRLSAHVSVRDTAQRRQEEKSIVRRTRKHEHTRAKIQTHGSHVTGRRCPRAWGRARNTSQTQLTFNELFLRLSGFFYQNTNNSWRIKQLTQKQIEKKIYSINLQSGARTHTSATHDTRFYLLNTAPLISCELARKLRYV